MRTCRLMLVVLGTCPVAEAARLHEAAVGEVVSVPAFAYAADKSFTAPLHLRRIEVYAGDARILVPLPGGDYRELPRSDRRFFIADGQKTASRLYLSISADGTEFEGGLFDADGTYAFSGRVEGDRLMREHGGKLDPALSHSYTCGNQARLAQPALPADPEPFAASALKARSKGATHTAVVAVDTDNELFTGKFGDSPAGLTNATNYLAALFTGMNVFYGRDLGVSLVQGTTFLRAPHASGADPYVQTNAGNQLNEISAAWLNTPALFSINRAFVAFLSGKSSSPSSSSGIGWVVGSGSYCTAKGVVFGGGQVFGHYSVNQVFRFNGSTAANDVSLVGHEIGHNFGADHTHCSDRTTGAGDRSTNTIDQCFTGESGCYSGPVSCPTDNSVPGRGSLMSYCHFGGGNAAGCGPSLLEFHPAQENLLGARVATNIGNGCFASLTQNIGPTLAAAAPASGSTTAMPDGSLGATVSRTITFTASGGAGSGTTSLQCSVTAGTVGIASGTPQTVAVAGSVAPVVARFTLGGAAQSGSIACVATPQGGTAANFTYSFTAPAAAAACTGTCIFRNGFES